MIDDDRPAWHADALCKGKTDVFFPSRGEDTARAKRICAACPVRAECLDHALTTGEHYGIWGGHSERSRRRLRRALGYPDPTPENLEDIA